MSGSESQSQNSSNPQMTPQQMLNAYNTNLPSSLGVVNSTVGGTATNLAQGASAANPIYTQSGLNQLNQYGSGYQQSGANLATQQAGSTAGLLSGAGGQAAANAVNLNNSLNPTQAAANQGAQTQLNSINMTGLSPGEYNATERAVNQGNQATGNLGLSNGMNNISNAMNFGGAFNSKLGLLNTATNTAANVAGSQNSQVNPVSTALGAGSTAGNYGLNNMNTTQANTNLTLPYSYATSLGNQISGIASAQKSNGNSNSASGGCFLTTVACEWKGKHNNCEELSILRDFRDNFVPRHTVEEYYKIAPGIAQKIRNNPEKLEFVWQKVQFCVDLIKAGDYPEALNEYRGMVKELL